MIVYVYLVTNLVNKKQYVGKTTETVTKRWSKHISDARLGKGSYLHKAIRKYSPESFIVSPIAHFSDNGTLCIVEQLFISELGTFAPNGYNLTRGGEGMLGYVASEETRRKIGQKSKGRISGMRGRRHTESALAKQSLSHQGNIPWNKGKKGVQKISEETRKKHSENGKGRKNSEETKLRMSLAASLRWQRQHAIDSGAISSRDFSASPQLGNAHISSSFGA